MKAKDDVRAQHFIEQEVCFTAHPAPVHALAFHPSMDSCIISASRTVKVWLFAGGAGENNPQRACAATSHSKSSESRKNSQTGQGKQNSKSKSVKSDAQLVVSMPADAYHATCVEIWASPRSELATVVVGNLDGGVIIWSLEISRNVEANPGQVSARVCKRHRITCHTKAITALSLQHFADERLQCVSASRDGTVAVFHAITGHLLRHFNSDPDVHSNSISPSAVTLAEYMHHSNLFVRKMAADAISDMAEVGDHGAVAAIAMQLVNDDPGIREMVLQPLQRLIRKGDEDCVAAVSGMLLVRSVDVRKSVEIAVGYAVASESDAELLVKIADDISESYTSCHTPVAVATDIVLDSLDFLSEQIDEGSERLADFLRRWDENYGVRPKRSGTTSRSMEASASTTQSQSKQLKLTNTGTQLMMLAAAVRIGRMHAQRDLAGIYRMLRHVNAEVRTLAGLVLAALSRNDPDKYLWETVAHTVAEAHNADGDTAVAATRALHAILAARVFDEIDVAIDVQIAENAARAAAEEARRQKRRIKSTKRTATPDGAKSMASSRPVTGEQVGIITTGHEAEVTGKQNVTGASPVYDSRLS